MNFLRPILAILASLAYGSSHTSEPVPNVTAVCEIFDTSKISDGGQPTPSKDAPLTGIMALTAQNGARCITKGVHGALDYYPILSEDHTQITLSGTVSLEGGSADIDVTSSLDASKYLGSVKATRSFPARILHLRQGLQHTRPPGKLELTDKVEISFERITMRTATAAAMLKPEKGVLDARLILDLTRTMIQQGYATTQSIGPLRIPFGQLEKVAERDQTLAVESHLSEDKQWLTIYLTFKSGENELVSTLKVKHGDSTFVGTLESEKTGYVTLVFLHTSSTP